MISRSRSAPTAEAMSIERTTSANNTVTCLYSAWESRSVTGAPQPSQNRAPSRGSVPHARHVVAPVIRPSTASRPRSSSCFRIGRSTSMRRSNWRTQDTRSWSPSRAVATACTSPDCGSGTVTVDRAISLPASGTSAPMGPRPRTVEPGLPSESVCGRAALRLNPTISDAGSATLVVSRVSRLAGHLYREGLCFPERRGVDVETVGGAGDLVGLRARADLGDWAQVLPIAAGEPAQVVDADRLDGGLARQVHYRGHP